MTVKTSRLIVEVDGEVVFSRFDIEGRNGGVNSLDQEVMLDVKAQLELALLQVQELLNHK
jgi:hypothetical protein